MNSIFLNPGAETNLSAAARQRFESCEGKPLLLANWDRALFMHFEVPVELLQPQVPFDLDLFEGRAFVSLVAFTMRGMRLAFGGRATQWMSAPFGQQRFLNVRTYVRHADEQGIYFLAEWISTGICVPFGRVTYGLPYRWGRLEFDHRPERGPLKGRVAARHGGGVLDYTAHLGAAPSFAVAEEGSLNHFLVERYSAFTQHRRQCRQFRIWHEAWPLRDADPEWSDDSLLRQEFSWWTDARLTGANYSPGVSDIWLGRPRGVTSDE
ncbi:MAG: uncharacterized protein QOF48_2558 [Verrucomicrobiota bacterium]|jgi:uncharacterized protein YqjF (DUF2071 family)